MITRLFNFYRMSNPLLSDESIITPSLVFTFSLNSLKIKIPDILLLVYMSSFSHILFSPYFHPGCLQQNTKINIAIVMETGDKLAEGKRDSFLTRKFEKCHSVESSRMITSKFLGENLTLVPKLDLKMSRSLSPNALQRVILSFPSSRQNSTSSC